MAEDQGEAVGVGGDQLIPLSSNPPSRNVHQIDLSRLFSDVSKTFSGIQTILGSTLPKAGSNANIGHQSDPSEKEAHSSMATHESGGPLAGLFGGTNVCFKACGMEDIQFAARRAGDLFLTLRICAILITGAIGLCTLAFFIYAALRLYRERREKLHSSSLSTPTQKRKSASFKTSDSIPHIRESPPFANQDATSSGGQKGWLAT